MNPADSIKKFVSVLETLDDDQIDAVTALLDTFVLIGEERCFDTINFYSGICHLLLIQKTGESMPKILKQSIEGVKQWVEEQNQEFDPYSMRGSGYV